jgi:hypothetical protein
MDSGIPRIVARHLLRVVNRPRQASGYRGQDMFHPVGPQSPSVYWRRRFVLLASIIALAVLAMLTLKVVLSGGGPGGSSASGATNTESPRAGHHSTPRSSKSSSKSAPSPTGRKSTRPRPGRSAATTPADKPSDTSSASGPKRCAASDLALAAVTNQPTYQVGDQPSLAIQVTNKSSAACVVDLADPQIVLRVYNGESRVWGSHDCQVTPGTNDRTLMAGAAVKVSIIWSGLSSQPNCAGTRQRVGAGTYTLYASLAGHEGKSADFTIK